MKTGRPKRTLDEIMSESYRCTNCDWQGPNRERIWARATGDVEPVRGYICPECYKTTTEPMKKDE